MLESYAVGTENREHRCRVGRGHGRCHEQGYRYAHTRHRVQPTEDKVDNHTRNHHGQQHAYSRQCQTRRHDGTDVRQLRVQSTREEDNTQRYRTDGLRRTHIEHIAHTVIVDETTYAVWTKQHTYHQEEQQGRYTKLISDFIGENARKKEH